MRMLACLVAVLLGACATPSPVADRAPIQVWAQLGPQAIVSLRAIVSADSPCPQADVDSVLLPLQRRAAASLVAAASDNPAYRPAFPVEACELALSPAARTVAVGGRSIALPKAEMQRIVVLGDTGCRIKVPASGRADPLQDCSDAAAWPWRRIAAAAAQTLPDLVIHVGDYHYREYCDAPERCSPLREKGVVVGYGWAGWDADFFTPAAPLLAAAPWVFVRGNHENCDRAGEGWMRFLSPFPYLPCGDQRYRSASASVLGNNQTADAYRIPLDSQLGLVVVDNSGHEDYRPADATPQDVEIFRRNLGILQNAPPSQQQWLFSHRPIWYDLLAAAAQPNALQLALRNTLPDNLQLAFAGHQHAFATSNFSPDADLLYHPAGRPAQVIVGGGGSQLESLDPKSPLYEGGGGPGSKERAQPDGRLYDGVAALSGILLNRYSFLLLERDSKGWAGSVRDSNGNVLSRCRLTDGRKELACAFPGH